MKTERNIFIAFLLNLSFSVFEFFGGIITGSVAIISDAVHDIGDAASIGASYFLERKSKKQPDEIYTYGYTRYSVIGSVITTLILLVGSAAVIYNAIIRIINPTEINYNGMIIFAIVGVVVNLAAAFFTREGDSLNQKAVNLHMLEDVLGWVLVLVGAFVMRFTDFVYLDPIMSICLALFIIINAFKNLIDVVNVFLEKAPKGIDIKELCDGLCRVDGVTDVHHFHLRSFDGQNNSATMHIVTDSDAHCVKENVRIFLKQKGIEHATIEIETTDEDCDDKNCNLEFDNRTQHNHHHHNHNHNHH